MKFSLPMIDALLASGDLRECVACFQMSSDCQNLVTTRSGFQADAKPGEIAHIESMSPEEWVCGHCGAKNIHTDSTLIAKAYPKRHQSQMVWP